MELKKLLTGIENLKSKGDLEIDIKKVECNSKNIKPNSLFIAIKGYAQRFPQLRSLPKKSRMMYSGLRPLSG